MPLVRAQPKVRVPEQRREPSSNQGHSPNRKQQLTARQSRRLTSGGEAVAEVCQKHRLRVAAEDNHEGVVAWWVV